VRISVGGLSPTINWKDLAKEEFVLPPLETQRRIADLLSATQRTIDTAFNARRRCLSLRRALSASLLYGSFEEGCQDLTGAWQRKGWAVARIGDLVNDNAPVCYGIVQPGNSVPGGVPTLSSNNLNVGFRDDIHFTSTDIERSYARSRVEKGDVLIAVKGFGTGKIGIVPDYFSGNITRDLARLRFGETLLPQLFKHIWIDAAYCRYWQAMSVGSTRPEMSIGTLRNLLMPVPSPDEQRQLIVQLEQIEQAEAALSDRIDGARQLLRKLITLTLSGQPSGCS